MIHFKIHLSVHCDATNRIVTATVRNCTDSAITIGNLNYANLKFRHAESDEPVMAWLSVHVGNSDGIRVLAPGESVQYTCEYLKDYKFPQPGLYAVWIAYDTTGFKARFSGDRGLHDQLDQLDQLDQVDEIRCLSDKITIELSSSDIETNRLQLRSLESMLSIETRSK